MSKLKTYYDTTKYLKPSQVSARLVRKLKSSEKPDVSAAPEHRKIGLMIPELDLNGEYAKRFEPEIIPDGKVKLLNRVFELDFSDEAKAKMSPLEWYNLQYFEYAVALGYMYRKTGEAVYAEAFEKAYRVYLRADLPYAPYVISLQIPNLLISVELFGDALDGAFTEEVNREIYRQYRYLSSHQETHLLGNHYFENLKTLVLVSRYFMDDAACEKYMRKLKTQAVEQILPDGMHFELSPMYHKIILEDLLRLNSIDGLPESDWLKPAIWRMVNALATLESGISRTPLFNDSGDNVAKTAEALLKAAEEYCGIVPQKQMSLQHSKYFRMEADEAVVLIDGGKIGPDYMPGHGHSDCLSFEMFFNGEPVIVNSGTYQYQGEKRKYFRSMCAHNTLVMDDNEQSQCWGEHRVAKRIGSVSSALDGMVFEGRYTNWRGQTHKRRISAGNREISVTDETQNAENIKSYVRVPCRYEVTDSLEVRDGGGSTICSIVPLKCGYSVIRDGEMTAYAPEFGKLEKCTCIEFTWTADGEAHGYSVKY